MKIKLQGILYIENTKCLTNIIQSGNALRKIYFHLFCFWEIARKKKMFLSMYTFIRGVFDVQVYTIIIVIPYVYALHKWTEHIFVKWPTGNNGIHHEEKNLKISHHPTAHHQIG